jgi:hypothetical protein
LEADPATTRKHLERLETEVQRVVKRLTAARRAVDAAFERSDTSAS